MVTKSNFHCNTYTPSKGRIITVFAFYLKLRRGLHLQSQVHTILFCMYCLYEIYYYTSPSNCTKWYNTL